MTKEIKPYGQRVAVMDPPTEDQKSSDIWTPTPYDDYHVGIVVNLGQRVNVEPLEEHIALGDRVHYQEQCAKQVGDVKIIDVDCIIAIERGED